MKIVHRIFLVLICGLIVAAWVLPGLAYAQDQKPMSQSMSAEEKKAKAAADKDYPKSVRDTGDKASSTGPNDDYDYCGAEETCGQPQWNSGQTGIRCVPKSACTSSGTGCGCNVFYRKTGERKYTYIGGEGRNYHSHNKKNNEIYACYCTV